MHSRIIQDNFLFHYRLHLPGDPPVPAAIKAKWFWDPVLTDIFVYNLQVPIDYWLSILSRFPAAPYNPNATVEGRISLHLIYGHIQLYPVPHLDRHHRQNQNPYPVVSGEQGLSYQLAPASVLLVSTPTIQSFGNQKEAAAFISELQLDDAQLLGLVQNLNLPGQKNDRLASVSQALMEGKLIVIVDQQSVTSPASAGSTNVVPAEASKPVSLGPHEEGLHNQEWDEVKITDDSFKTTRQVDMENLSEDDAIARRELKKQGWKDKKIKEVLNSGENVSTKELVPGDKLYGFDTKGRKKNIKNSAYWLDEAGYQDVKSKYYKDGQWNKEGVKNYLALPCFNRANAVSTVEVTEKTTVVEARVVKARELVQYTDNSGYTTGMIGKIMPGGGTQVTANPSVLVTL